MALTEMTVVAQANWDGGFLDVVTFKGDSLYAAGGAAFEALFEALIGHDREIMCAIGYGADNSVEFIPATGKLKMRTAAGVEVANDVDLDAVTFRVNVFSR